MNKISLLLLGVTLLLAYVGSVEGTRREKLAYVGRSLVGLHKNVPERRAKYSYEVKVWELVGHQTSVFA